MVGGGTWSNEPLWGRSMPAQPDGAELSPRPTRLTCSQVIDSLHLNVTGFSGSRSPLGLPASRMLFTTGGSNRVEPW